MSDKDLDQMLTEFGVDPATVGEASEEQVATVMARCFPETLDPAFFSDGVSLLSMSDKEIAHVKELLEIQDTEPLSPDAARIVELERHVERLRVGFETMGAAQRRANPVLAVALELGRHWNAQETCDLDEGSRYRLDSLAAAVEAFDALQPKG